MQVSDKDIQQMIADGVGKIPAIKLIRQVEGIGLADAKKIAEKFSGWQSDVAYSGTTQAQRDTYRGVNSATFKRLSSTPFDPSPQAQYKPPALFDLITERLREHSRTSDEVKEHLKQAGVEADDEKDFQQKLIQFADWLVAKFTFEEDK